MSKSVDLVNNGIRWKKESKLVDFDFADDIALILFRMDFSGLLTDVGRAKKAHLPKNLSHISCNDETWYSYTLPKEDPKNI